MCTFLVQNEPNKNMTEDKNCWWLKFNHQPDGTEYVTNVGRCSFSVR